MSAAPDTMVTAADETRPAQPISSREAWDAVEAAHRQAAKSAREALTARQAAQRAASDRMPEGQRANWPYIATLPDVAPLNVAEREAMRLEDVAEKVLASSQAPDWRGWVVKLHVARPHADRLLGPTCADSWKELRKRGERDGFPGSFFIFEAEYLALLAHAGLATEDQARRIPELVAKASAKAGFAMRDAADAELHEVGFAHLLADAKRLLEQPVRTPPPACPPTKWDDALAAVAHWQAVADQESAAYHAAYKAVGAEIPEGLYDENRNGRHLRWRTLEVFDRNAAELMPSARVPLRAKLEAWLPRYAELRALHNLDELERDDDPTFDARHNAQEELFDLPPPSIRALAQKVELYSKEIDDEKNGFSDPAYLSQQLHSYLPARSLARVYLDLLELAGAPPPIGSDFNPRVWIKEYEAAGGGVKEDDGSRGLLLGRAFAGADHSKCRVLEDALYETPRKARAVRLEVLEDGYRTRGGDGNRGRFSWVQFTDDDYKIVTPRIHFAGEFRAERVSA